MSIVERDEYSHADFNVAINASAQARTDFIRRTYAHLFGAILAFIGLETVLLNLPMAKQLAFSMIRGYNFLIVLAAFIFTSYLAEKWAITAVSKSKQYMGLGLFVVAEAIIFLPLLYIATLYGGKDVIPTAGIVTLGIFGGLTGIVFISKKDFSFMGSILNVLALGALAYIVCGILFGFSMGVGFTILMIMLASGFILYDTSNILNHYRTDQHIAASLALFASVALLFWYVLQLFMARD